jgi:hypothetical protein
MRQNSGIYVAVNSNVAGWLPMQGMALFAAELRPCFDMVLYCRSARSTCICGPVMRITRRIPCGYSVTVCQGFAVDPWIHGAGPDSVQCLSAQSCHAMTLLV